MFDHYPTLLSSSYLKSEITMIGQFLLSAREAGILVSVFTNYYNQIVFHWARFEVEDFYVHLMNLQQFYHFYCLFSMYFRMAFEIHDTFLCTVFVKAIVRDRLILKWMDFYLLKVLIDFPTHFRSMGCFLWLHF